MIIGKEIGKWKTTTGNAMMTSQFLNCTNILILFNSVSTAILKKACKARLEDMCTSSFVGWI